MSLFHDAQYTDTEYQERVGWGHSTLSHALAFARLAGVKHFMPFHHDPAHDDETLDRFFGAATTRPDEAFTVEAAREGTTFDITAPTNV